MGIASVLLREARRASGQTQRELAALAGTSAATLAAYETSAKDPRTDTLSRLLGATGREIVLAPRRSRNERFVDLMCERLAAVVLDRPELIEEARSVLVQNKGRSSWTHVWEGLLDAGPIAVAAVLTSADPSVRSLRADNPFAVMGLITFDERDDILRRAREHP